MKNPYQRKVANQAMKTHKTALLGTLLLVLSFCAGDDSGPGKITCFSEPDQTFRCYPAGEDVISECGEFLEEARFSGDSSELESCSSYDLGDYRVYGATTEFSIDYEDDAYVGPYFGSICKYNSCISAVATFDSTCTRQWDGEEGGLAEELCMSSCSLSMCINLLSGFGREALNNCDQCADFDL